MRKSRFEFITKALVPPMLDETSTVGVVCVYCLLILFLGINVAASDELFPDEQPQVYSHPLDTTGYPDYTRRPHRVPTWKTFENMPQFVCIRNLPDKNFVDHGLGRVFWPHWGVLHVADLDDRLARVRAMGGYVFNVSGYVGGTTTRRNFDKDIIRHVHERLGDRFLGMDIGEQDGRYLFVAKGRQHPFANTRVKQYLETYKYIQQVAEDQGNWMSTLHVNWYWHYPIKEGTVSVAGAETQNKVTSSPIHYAFIRGAGKQYGVHWYGNVALWNPWGYKGYFDDNETCGPTKGNSLNLMRRLMFSHYLYNSVILSFEGSWYTNAYNPMAGGPLSPIGVIQRGAVEHVKQYGQPGEMHAPVALLMDYFSGWMGARTEGSTYKVWNALPYGAGDYLTHNVFAQLYPGYEDSSIYHDERGTYTNTPYGDMADAILTDVSSQGMKRYGLIVAAGDLPSAGPELRDKVESFVNEGGHFIVTAENAIRLWPEWGFGSSQSIEADSMVTWNNGQEVTESHAFALMVTNALPEGNVVLAKCKTVPAVVNIPMGKGQITLLLSPFGINTKSIADIIWRRGEREKPLEQPFVLLNHVQQTLASAIKNQQLFSVGDDLGFITCRKEPGKYTLGLFNNGLKQKPFKITSHCGDIKNIEELRLGHSVQHEPGYWPGGFEDNDGGVSDESTIAGGDVRLFSVTTEEKGLRVKKEVRPARRPRDRFLTMPDTHDVKTSIMLYPTFFEHFDGVKLDWTYLLHRDAKQLQRERPWLERQQLKIMVDFSSDMNHFPGLTLIDHDHDQYAENVEFENDVFDKMVLLGAKDAVICMHAIPEFNIKPEAIEPLMIGGLQDFCQRAQARGITVHLQNLTSHRWGGSTSHVLGLIKKAHIGNLRFALNTADDHDIRSAIKNADTKLGMILLSAPGPVTGEMQIPLHQRNMTLKGLESIDVLLVFDASYANQDEVYLDIKRLGDIWK